MENPLYLSVVLSTYNDEKYIAESINSILNQTYPYFEFIIVNDGSTDNTLSIIKSFDDSRIRLIDKPNTGLVDSLNIGVKAAKYDWIARMDGDDIAEPNRFEEEIGYLKNGIAVVSAGIRIINAEGEITSVPSSKRIFVNSATRLGLQFIVHPLAIFNKTIWEKVGGYDPYMYKNEDCDLWVKMSFWGKLIVIDKKLLRYRRHGNNITSSTDERQKLTQWIRVIKAAHREPNCLPIEIYEKLVNHIKTIPLFCESRNVQYRGLSLLWFVVKRYFILKYSHKISQILCLLPKKI